MKSIIAQFPITLFFFIISLGINPILTAQEQKIMEAIFEQTEKFRKAF